MKLEQGELSNFENIPPETSFEDNKDVRKHQKKRTYEDIPVSEHHKQKLKKDLYKQPTVDELNTLKETENLYNNNLFRLQIDELISEVNIKNKRKKELSTWVNSFENFLGTLPEYQFATSSLHFIDKVNTKFDKFLLNISKYKPPFETDQNLTVKVTKPTQMTMFGLYAINCQPGPKVTLKINLEIPKECFHSKDFLNNRYYIKHFYYLLYILEHLKSKGIANILRLKNHESNVLIPILEVEPTDCSKCVVLIYVTPSANVFKPSRFYPEQNNVKVDVFNMNVNIEILKTSSTPFYNSALAHDVTLTQNIQYVKDSLSDYKNIHEGIKLLSMWLYQRELHLNIVPFSETLIVYFIVYLLQKKKINKYMSSYQVIRNFWNFVVNSDLENEPIALTETTPAVIGSFKQHFDVVFIDRSGCYNLTAFLTSQMYSRVKTECEIALKYLDTNNNNSFFQLFLTKFPFHLQYDVIIDLSQSLPLKNKFELNETEKALYIGFEHLLIVKHILKIFDQALNKRCTNIIPKLETNDKDLVKLLIGINLNMEEAFSILLKGPALNDITSASEFRKFWGQLASDRRFRDGSTNVAVHFKTNTMKGRRNIIRKILAFILDEKLSLKYHLYYNEFEEVLINKKVVPSYASGTNEEMTLKIIHASDELGKKLRALEMSLKITGVQGLSNVYTFTEVFPPIPTNYKVSTYNFINIRFYYVL